MSLDRRMVLLPLALLLALAGAACYGATSGYAVVSDTRPPPPAYAYIDARPGYVWVEGRWAWTAYGWEWLDGYWVPRRDGYLFVQGDWVYRSDRYHWRDGYWVRNPGYDVEVRDHRHGRSTYPHDNRIYRERGGRIYRDQARGSPPGKVRVRARPSYR